MKPVLSVLLVALALAGCQQVVTVEKKVIETVEVEKVVEKPVLQTVEVEKVVEKEVQVTVAPMEAAPVTFTAQRTG